MIIGSKGRFGIEVLLNDVKVGNDIYLTERIQFMYGNMCFWAGNSMIGNYEVGGSLSVARALIAHLLEHKGLRQDPELWTLSTDNLFDSIDKTLYYDSDKSDEQIASDWKKYSIFIGKPDGLDIFDGWKAYLIQQDLNARYLWKHYSERTVHEVALQFSEFDNCLVQFVQWFDRLTIFSN